MSLPTTCGVQSKEDFEIPLDSKPLNREGPKYLTSYAPVLKDAKQAVVAVHTAQIVRVIQSEGYYDLGEEKMLRRFSDFLCHVVGWSAEG